MTTSSPKERIVGDVVSLQLVSLMAFKSEELAVHITELGNQLEVLGQAIQEMVAATKEKN